MRLQSFKKITAACLVMISAIGCQDLDVVNENQPDRERALSSPVDVEALAGSNFVILYTRLHRSDSWINPLSPMADEFTATYANNATLEVANEPRLQLNNTPGTSASDISRNGWSDINSIVASGNEVLNAIEVRGMKIMTPDAAGTIVDNTARARAFAYFMRGVGYGYLANAWDKASVITHLDTLPAEPEALNAFVIERHTPYTKVLDQALADLEQAVVIAQQNTFTLPVSWIPGTTYSNTDLVKIANSYIARFIVYNARTPQERANANWQKVLTTTAAGITTDFGPVLDPATLSGSTFLSRAQTSGTFVMRGDYKLVGPADVSGNFQKWLATPVEQRTRFNITTPDRRITGTTPTSSGAYFRYRSDDNGYRTDRGTYNFSGYQWFRRAGNSTTGALMMFGADELRLLRAEAMARTGNTTEAANLANVSRTRQQKIGTATFAGLPALTAAGVPQSTDCVPRTKTAACAGLLEAIMYERMIESAGSDPIRAWFDSRGWGRLPEGTILHFPIPGRELESIRLPLYTFGGVGGVGAAAKGMWEL
jgi:hypothetical protein